MTQVRLQKFLAECGAGSRRKMEQFIKEGRVRVNGQVVTELGRKIDPSVDQVEVNRRPVRAAPKGIILLNKPRGVVSTLSDPEGRRTVSEFLTKHYSSYFPVGRLDWDSTGLIIMTNDGEMAEKLMHPRFGFERTYEARVEGSVNQAVLDKLESGIRLSDGLVRAEAEVMSSDQESTWVQVNIKEGRNRVVRRIFEKIGHPVIKLKRTVYGPFKLGRLQVGHVRVLTAREYLQVRHKVMTFKGEDKSAPAPEPARKQASRPEGRLSDFERERPRLKPKAFRPNKDDGRDERRGGSRRRDDRARGDRQIGERRQDGEHRKGGERRPSGERRQGGERRPSGGRRQGGERRQDGRRDSVPRGKSRGGVARRPRAPKRSRS